MIGLGRMGMNMAKRLLQGGHEVVAYNRTPTKTEEIVKEGAIGSFSLTELVDKLAAPRVVWLMLPAGKPVDDHLDQLLELLAPGDIVIDGGNTYYKDDIRRAELLATKAIKFMDVGVSGGIWGLEIGYCMMMGGEREIFEHLEPIFKTLAPEDGYLYCGRWTVQQAVESGVSAPVIALSLFNRFKSREEDAFEDRVLAALRREFGGHAVVTAKEG